MKAGQQVRTKSVLCCYWPAIASGGCNGMQEWIENYFRVEPTTCVMARKKRRWIHMHALLQVAAINLEEYYDFSGTYL